MKQTSCESFRNVSTVGDLTVCSCLNLDLEEQIQILLHPLHLLPAAAGAGLQGSEGNRSLLPPSPGQSLCSSGGLAVPVRVVEKHLFSNPCYNLLVTFL